MGNNGIQPLSIDPLHVDGTHVVRGGGVAHDEVYRPLVALGIGGRAERAAQRPCAVAGHACS